MVDLVTLLSVLAASGWWIAAVQWQRAFVLTRLRALERRAAERSRVIRYVEGIIAGRR